MGSYRVRITIDEKWVDNFNAAGMSLCMANATKDTSGTGVDDVADKTFTKLAPTLDITWTDEYNTQASAIFFNKGAKIEGFASSKSTQFGETYTVAGLTRVQTSKDGDNEGNDSIGFRNEVPASILLSVKEGSNWTQVYTSPFPIPPGMTTLTPVTKVVFWFQQKTETSTMIANFRGNKMTVNVSPGQTSTLNFTDSGEWTTVA